MTDEATGKRSREEQLAWEGRVGRVAGVGALAAIVLTLGAQVYLALSIREPIRDRAQALDLVGRHVTELVGGAIARGAGFLLIGGAVAFLVIAARYRRPATPVGVAAVVLVAVGAVAVAEVVREVSLAGVASDFVGGRGEPRDADRLLRGLSSGSVAQFVLGANLAFGLAMLLAGRSAMRAGLLNRFLGTLAMVIGVLFGLPLLGLPSAGQTLLVFWVAAVALILLDRWPGGRGPAWSTGEATPWPSAMDRRAELERHRVEAEEQAAEADGGEPPARPKRKRGRSGR